MISNEPNHSDFQRGNPYATPGRSERIKASRTAYTSSGQQESVAEHIWRLSLMAVLMEPHLTQNVDMARLPKLIIIHDLVEAEAGDIPVLDVIRNPALRVIKQQRETQAIDNLCDQLGELLGKAIYELWHEFEAKATYKAQVANAFDKLEVQLQHHHADLSTWEEIEYDLTYMMNRPRLRCEFATTQATYQRRGRPENESIGDRYRLDSSTDTIGVNPGVMTYFLLDM